MLLGVVTGLLAQGMAALPAAALAAYLHGAAADRIAARRGSTGLLASELLPALPAAIAALRDAPPAPPFERELAAASRSPEETERAGARSLAAAIDASGAIVLLSGPLGAGKTRFVKGLAAGLGIASERVQSPTFVVAQELPVPDGRALVHVDCYRIASEAELESAGLLDWLAPGALLVAEWPERVPRAWPADRLELGFARGAGESEREIAAAARGPHSAALLARWGV